MVLRSRNDVAQLEARANAGVKGTARWGHAVEAERAQEDVQMGGQQGDVPIAGEGTPVLDFGDMPVASIGSGGDVGVAGADVPVTEGAPPIRPFPLPLPQTPPLPLVQPATAMDGA